jgi:Flp pilus assembly protein TadD
MNLLDKSSVADELIHQAREAFHRGNLTAAGKHLSAALALAPDADLALALGHIKFSAGGVYEALQEYSKAARLDPHCAAAHASRALALQLLGYARDARAAAEQALVLSPGEPTAARVLARMRLDSQNCGGIRTSCQSILDGYLRPLTQALYEREEELCPA